MPRQMNLHSWLNTFVSAGLLVTAIFYGGAMWRDVQTLNAFKEHTEKSGTPRLVTHEAMDDERIGALKRENQVQDGRLDKAELAITVVTDMRGDLKVITSKLDRLQDDLKAHEQRARQFQQSETR